MPQEKLIAGIILSIDAGTQSIRAALVDTSGNILHIVKTPIQLIFQSIRLGGAAAGLLLGGVLQNNRTTLQKQENLKKISQASRLRHSGHHDQFR